MTTRIILIAMGLMALPTIAYFIWLAPRADDYAKEVAVERDSSVEKQVQEDLGIGKAYGVELVGKKGTFFKLEAYLIRDPETRATIIARWKSESFHEVYAGAGDPPCSVVSDESVPMAIVPICSEGTGSQKIAIDRTNPVRGVLSRFFTGFY